MLICGLFVTDVIINAVNGISGWFVCGLELIIGVHQGYILRAVAYLDGENMGALNQFKRWLR